MRPPLRLARMANEARNAFVTVRASGLLQLARERARCQCFVLCNPLLQCIPWLIVGFIFLLVVVVVSCTALRLEVSVQVGLRCYAFGPGYLCYAVERLGNRNQNEHEASKSFEAPVSLGGSRMAEPRLPDETFHFPHDEFFATQLATHPYAQMVWLLLGYITLHAVVAPHGVGEVGPHILVGKALFNANSVGFCILKRVSKPPYAETVRDH